MSKLAIIGGSAANELISKKYFGSYKNVPAVKTPFGKVSDIRRYKNSGLEFYFLPRHGVDGYKTAAPFVNYRANIWALKELGVERIISWSGPGIINPDFEVGNYAVPHDIIDQTRNRPSTFFEKGGLGFIRMSHPFCPDLQHALIYSLENLNCEFYPESVYCCTEGPRLETPAEIRLYHSYGTDLVGMTLAPEAFLARELEICYAALCYLTNFAEGIVNRQFEVGVLFEGMMSPEEKKLVDDAVKKMPEIIIEALKAIFNHSRDCQCKNAMDRYKKQGIITDQWRKWIDP
jgi:5'-methylthioadenosine phosphorylase